MSDQSTGRVATLAGVARGWRDSLHPRFTLVNIMSRAVPDFVSGWIRSRLYRLAGLDVAKTAFLMGNIAVRAGTKGHLSKLHIADGARLSTDVTINCDDEVFIDENVVIGPFARIYTTTHSLGPGSQRCDPATLHGPVRIGRGSWLAIGVTVLPGVTIGPGCVIGAGAVVTEDVPANSLVEGVPAVVVRTLPFGDR